MNTWAAAASIAAVLIILLLEWLATTIKKGRHP